MTLRPSVSYHWAARFLDADGHDVDELAAETLGGLAALLRDRPAQYPLVVLWLIRSRGNMVEGVIDTDMASLTSAGLPVFFGGSSVKRVPDAMKAEADREGAAVLEAAERAMG